MSAGFRWRWPAILVGLVALGLAVAWLVWPRGTKVGETAIYPASGASVSAALDSGDRLVFRVDVEVSLAGYDDHDEEVARDALWRSVLTVRAARVGSADLVASCPANGSLSLGTTIVGRTLSVSGVSVECAIRVAEGGNYTITGAIVPAADLAMKTAALEVRRERTR